MELKPYNVDRIDEGQFIKAVNAAIAQATNGLISNQAVYGIDASLKAKSKVKLELSFSWIGTSGMTIGCKHSIKLELPNPPARADTLAVDTDAGTGELFAGVQDYGGSTDNPRQRVFGDSQGNGIDPLSGERSEGRTFKIDGTSGAHLGRSSGIAGA